MDGEYADWLEAELKWALEYILGVNNSVWTEEEAMWRAHTDLQVLSPVREVAYEKE